MEPCKYSVNCPIYQYFKTSAAKNMYRNKYCHGNFNECQRYKLRQQGQKPPERLLPDGNMLTEYHIKMAKKP